VEQGGPDIQPIQAIPRAMGMGMGMGMAVSKFSVSSVAGGSGLGVGTQSYPPRAGERSGLVSPDDAVNLGFVEARVGQEGVRLPGGMSI